QDQIRQVVPVAQKTLASLGLLEVAIGADGEIGAFERDIERQFAGPKPFPDIDRVVSECPAALGERTSGKLLLEKQGGEHVVQRRVARQHQTANRAGALDENDAALVEREQSEVPGAPVLRVLGKQQELAGLGRG